MLGTRIMTAAVLAAVFIGALFYAPRAGWLVFCAVALAAAAWEWGRLSRLRPAGAASLTIATVALVGALSWSGAAPSNGYVYAVALLFWVAAAPVWLWKRPRTLPSGLLAAVGLVILGAAFLALIELRDESPALVLAVLAVLWISDSAAFFTGRRFGRRKLAPAISPGKTWEGAVGALAAVAVYGLAWQFFPAQAVPGTPDPRAAWLVAIALAFAVLGIIGDLFESQMKRDAGMKDSGNLLPGHGGVLDRIDALLPVLPAAAWMFAR